MIKGVYTETSGCITVGIQGFSDSSASCEWIDSNTTVDTSCVDTASVIVDSIPFDINVDINCKNGGSVHGTLVSYKVDVSVGLVCTVSIGPNGEQMWWCNGYNVLWNDGVPTLWVN